MRCINCDENKWENVDGYRYGEAGMCICKECGFVSYPSSYKSEEEIKSFYNGNYRPAPTSGNFVTSKAKVQYHHAFLNEYLEQWRSKKDFTACDIGAAIGLYLGWLKHEVPNAKIYGTEWDDNFKAIASLEYGIELTNDVDTSVKYDLISLYKVAEHVQDFDEELLKYRDLLKEDGLLYISAPVWFDIFYNYGKCDNDLRYYYSPEHINVWSRKIFKSIIGKCGFEIIKENTNTYDDTYLLKKCEFKPIEKENPEEIKKIMLAIKQSFEAFTQNKMDECLKLYPKQPTAWRRFYEVKRKEFEEMGIVKIEEWLKTVEAILPDCAEILDMHADILRRYGRYDEAIKYYKMCLSIKNGAIHYLGAISMCMREVYKKTGQIKYLEEARDIYRHIAQVSPETIMEVLTWIYNDNISIWKAKK